MAPCKKNFRKVRHTDRSLVGKSAIRVQSGASIATSRSLDDAAPRNGVNCCAHILQARLGVILASVLLHNVRAARVLAFVLLPEPKSIEAGEFLKSRGFETESR